MVSLRGSAWGDWVTGERVPGLRVGFFMGTFRLRVNCTTDAYRRSPVGVKEILECSNGPTRHDPSPCDQATRPI